MLIAKIVKKALQQYWRLSRSLTLGVKAVVLDGDDHVLLAWSPADTAWRLPAARVLKGEAAEDAVRRMLGLAFSIALESAPVCISVKPASDPPRDGHWAVLLVRRWRQNDAPSPRNDTSWFDATSLPANLDADDAKAIAVAFALGADGVAEA